jgi:hypothetical protein
MQCMVEKCHIKENPKQGSKGRIIKLDPIQGLFVHSILNYSRLNHSGFFPNQNQ